METVLLRHWAVNGVGHALFARYVEALSCLFPDVDLCCAELPEAIRGPGVFSTGRKTLLRALFQSHASERGMRLFCVCRIEREEYFLGRFIFW